MFGDYLGVFLIGIFVAIFIWKPWLKWGDKISERLGSRITWLGSWIKNKESKIENGKSEQPDKNKEAPKKLKDEALKKLKDALKELGWEFDLGNPMSDNLRKDIALQVYQQKYMVFRHFDTLRWAVPTGIAALGIVLLGQFKEPGIPHNYLRAAMLAIYGLIALASGYLLHRLAYHQACNTLALSWIAMQIGDPAVPPSTATEQPLKSAAFWFEMLMDLLAASALASAVWIIDKAP